jgi:hypothetical protein
MGRQAGNRHPSSAPPWSGLRRRKVGHEETRQGRNLSPQGGGRRVPGGIQRRGGGGGRRLLDGHRRGAGWGRGIGSKRGKAHFWLCYFIRHSLL